MADAYGPAIRNDRREGIYIEIILDLSPFLQSSDELMGEEGAMSLKGIYIYLIRITYRVTKYKKVRKEMKNIFAEMMFWIIILFCLFVFFNEYFVFLSLVSLHK